MPSNIDNGVKKRLNFKDVKDIKSKNSDHLQTNSKKKLQLQYDQTSENSDHLQVDQISTVPNCKNQIEAYKKDPLFTHKLLPKITLENDQKIPETSSLKSNLKTFDDKPTLNSSNSSIIDQTGK